MRSTTFFGIIAVLTASASLAACGSDTTSGTTGTGGSTSTTGDMTTTTSTTTTTTTTTTSTSSTSSSTGTGGAGPALVNGCDPTALVDYTKDATVEITFDDTYKYAPPCIKVKSG
jgi:hypothetical protein